MKKIIFLAILIAALAALFASSHPDGLEKVAISQGFIDRGVEHNSIMADYSLPFLNAGAVSTATSGIIGILLLLGVFCGVKSFFSLKNQPF